MNENTLIFCSFRRRVKLLTSQHILYLAIIVINGIVCKDCESFSFTQDLNMRNQICYFADDLKPSVSRSRIQCAQSCWMLNGCLSFFFDSKSKECMMTLHANLSAAVSCTLTEESAFYVSNNKSPERYLTTTLGGGYGTTTLNTNLCSSPYTFNSEHSLCYKVFDDAALTWSQARTQCLTDGGELPLLKDEQTFDFYQSLASSVSGSDGLWVGLQKVGTTWTWGDGTTADMSKTFWGFFEPSGDGYCGELLSFYGWMLNDSPCNTARYYICTIS